MPNDKVSQGMAVLSTAHLSAIGEIRRQMNQALTLVSAARSLTGPDMEAEGHTVAHELLDIAEDILADHEYINRLDELQLREGA
jgi:hypothetical protein